MDQTVKILQSKIIQHMKTRHQVKNKDPISLDDILEEINQLETTSTRIKQILETEILSCNEKIEVKIDKDGKKQYLFKPPFNIKKGKELIELLKKYQAEGKGGLYLEDVQESLPNADKIIENINKSTDVQVEIRMIIGKGKKKLLFLNERNPLEQIKIDQDIVEHWRKVQIEGLDEAKIEEYLENNKIASMKGKVGDNIDLSADSKKKGRKGREFKKHNKHVKLDDYNPELTTSRPKKPC